MIQTRLFESPDLYPEGKQNALRYGNKGAFAFGLNRQLEVGILDEYQTHNELDKEYSKYQGRIWLTDNRPFDGTGNPTISFWEYPPRDVLDIILDELSSYFSIDLSDPVLEIYSGFWKTLSYKEYPELGESGESAPVRVDHQQSPLLKQKKKVPNGIGSKKKTWNKSQKPFESLVTESPDEIFGMDTRYHYFKKITDYRSHLTHAFGYLDGKMHVSKEQGTHPEITKRVYGKWGADDRTKFKYPGRIWLGQKYISFWLYPKNKTELQKVIKDLEKSLSEFYKKPVKIWDDSEYKIDVNVIDEPKSSFGQDVEGDWGAYNEKSSQLIPLKDYKGSADASEEELKKPHTQSPMLKKKRMVYGGSKKNQSLAWKQAKMTSESFDVINENPNAIIKPIDWIKHKDNKSFTPITIEYNEDPKAIPFGFYGPDKVLITGSPKMIHTKLMKKAYDAGVIPQRKYLIERGQNFGRLFPRYKVITFWIYPKDVNELIYVIKQLEAKTKLNILDDPEWVVEIPGGEFKNHIDKGEQTGYNGWGSWHPRIGQIEYVSPKDYKGGYQRSKEELDSPHIESPMNKKEYDVPDGVGSKKPKPPLNWRQSMVGESIKGYLT